MAIAAIACHIANTAEAKLDVICGGLPSQTWTYLDEFVINIYRESATILGDGLPTSFWPTHLSFERARYDGFVCLRNLES